MKITGRNNAENTLIRDFIEAGNEHIFYFWDKLNNKEKDELISRLKTISLENTARFYKEFLDQDKAAKGSVRIDGPAQYYPYRQRATEKNIKELGEKALHDGKIAFITVAGGQASRLGYDYPKGCFPVSPVKKKSLFQVFSEKIAFYSSYYKCDFKWYIMTSEANHAGTRDFFEKNNFFGLKSDNVVFFSQGMIPSITQEGKLILKDDNRLFLNPDGHGGTLNALIRHGLLDRMEKDGVEYLSYFQVDNPLVEMADPYFLGYHIYKDSDVTSKVIAKTNHAEKLGNIASVDGRNMIVEYSDMPESLSKETAEDGRLKYLMGSIAIHIFNVRFLQETTEKLPVHFARKKLKGFVFDGSTPVRGEFDGIKFEKFIFDVIPLTDSSEFVETRREDEFYPLKNKTGVDSVDTCIGGQIAMYKSWLKDAGLELDADNDIVCEVSPLFAPDRDIFLEKYEKNADIIKKQIFNGDGSLKNEIYISGNE